jgi:putative colanic acid polymerase
MRTGKSHIRPASSFVGHRPGRFERGNTTLSHTAVLKKGFARTLALTLTIVCLHFTLVDIGGYPLTVAPFAALMFAVVSYKLEFPRSLLPLWSLLLAIPFVNLCFPGSSVDLFEFMRTYGLWIFAVTMLLFSAGARLRRRDSNWVGKAAFASLVILSLYSILQVVLYKYLSLDVLYNPFGSHQYLPLMNSRGQYDVSLYPNNIRAPGFYLEPSFNAFVITSMLFIITVTNKYRANFSLVLSGIALLFVNALSGLLIFAYVLLAYLILHSRRRRQPWVGSVILLVVVITAYMFGTTEYIWERITSGSIEGSSTNYRLVAPLGLLRDVLTHHITGLPFGTVEKVVSGYRMTNSLHQGSTLDNGFYLLVFYFGWLTVAAVVLAVLISAVFYRRWWTLSACYFVGYLLLSMNYSGGIMAPEYVFVVVMIIYSWRASKLENRTLSGRMSPKMHPPGPSFLLSRRLQASNLAKEVR